MSYEDIRIAIVGFGGQDVHEPAHVHTINGELFAQMKPSELNKALKELVFEGKKTTNAMEAIRMAAQYPFRPEASKIFLLITEEDKVEKNPQEIRELKKILAEQSITLNVFSSYKEIKKSKVDEIFGIKYNLDIITDKKVPKKHSISGLVKLPKGVYVELSTDTKGSIFSVDLLLEGEHRLLKQVSDVVVEQIESQIGTEKICKCFQGPAGEGITKCKVVPVPYY
uniref:von Willebrand factor n=1 Tax=Branchiostoma belcheri tsingtauense TaxID=155462 RepID=Q6IWF7_BRABE|nr:von Willebrand factor [Branchiostoma belcheri tsingtauense]